jgi:hypothetical protein
MRAQVNFSNPDEAFLMRLRKSGAIEKGFAPKVSFAFHRNGFAVSMRP